MTTLHFLPGNSKQLYDEGFIGCSKHREREKKTKFYINKHYLTIIFNYFSRFDLYYKDLDSPKTIGMTSKCLNKHVLIFLLIEMAFPV